ncbi:MAG TPA: hypothetical protein VMI12_15820 [Puia sp.]|nr:hypothetical protein [Puia sp.]
MLSLFIVVFYTYFIQIQHYFAMMDQSYLDILKIFIGSIGWIGGLTLYMWRREKKKNPAFSLIQSQNIQE